MKRAAKIVSIAAAVGFCLSATATAQTLNKYVMPDGRVVYSDRPVPGGKLVREVAPPTPVDPAARSKAEEAAQRDREAVSASRERIDERNAQRDAQRKTVQQLRAELEEAKRNLEQGVEPLPGEHSGNVGGGSRLNQAYWSRQEANKNKVEAAQRALDQALAQQRR